MGWSRKVNYNGRSERSRGSGTIIHLGGKHQNVSIRGFLRDTELRGSRNKITLPDILGELDRRMAEYMAMKKAGQSCPCPACRQPFELQLNGL